MSALGMGSGFALGLASSLHCVGMCGGISLLLGGDGCAGNARATLRSQLLLHGGRIASYAALGSLAGGASSLAIGHLDPIAGHQLLRWAAAVSLAWIGLATIGLLPAPTFMAHAFAPNRAVIGLLFKLPGSVRRFSSGMAWGMMPCGMVYGALLFALFTGSAVGGALTMIGFGAGTLPSLIVARLGWGRLTALLRTHGAERAVGMALVAVAILSVIGDRSTISAFCAHISSSF